jgi:hypothetical protein
MNGDIDTLIKYIGELFVFDEKKYPELVGATDKQKFIFAIRHSALHFSKVAGKISSVAEGIDHGGETDIEEIKKYIPKALANTLKLAEIVGMTEEEIIHAIEEKYKVKVG